MIGALFVFLGGGAGAVARYGVGVVAARWFGAGFPAGTLFVNVVGGFLMGLLAGYLAHRLSESANMRLLLGTGFLGGFTTFSAFALDAAFLFERGSQMLAFAYVAVSVFGALAALAAGLFVSRMVLT